MRIHRNEAGVIRLFFAGPPGGVACHGAGAAQIFTVYENFSGKIVSVLILYNSLFLIDM